MRYKGFLNGGSSKWIVCNGNSSTNMYMVCVNQYFRKLSYNQHKQAHSIRKGFPIKMGDPSCHKTDIDCVDWDYPMIPCLCNPKSHIYFICWCLDLFNSSLANLCSTVFLPAWYYIYILCRLYLLISTKYIYIYILCRLYSLYYVCIHILV